jgi:hypothetical protein
MTIISALVMTVSLAGAGSSLPNKSSQPVKAREAKPNISAVANTCLSKLVYFFKIKTSFRRPNRTAYFFHISRLMKKLVRPLQLTPGKL